jgi:hypothetical protein
MIVTADIWKSWSKTMFTAHIAGIKYTTVANRWQQENGIARKNAEKQQMTFTTHKKWRFIMGASKNKFTAEREADELRQSYEELMELRSNMAQHIDNFFKALGEEKLIKD